MQISQIIRKCNSNFSTNFVSLHQQSSLMTGVFVRLSMQEDLHHHDQQARQKKVPFLYRNKSACQPGHSCRSDVSDTSTIRYKKDWLKKGRLLIFAMVLMPDGTIRYRLPAVKADKILNDSL